MKTKVSVSLPSDLLEEIDHEAAQTSRSRSQIFEVWLRLAARRLHVLQRQRRAGAAARDAVTAGFER